MILLVPQKKVLLTRRGEYMPGKRRYKSHNLFKEPKRTKIYINEIDLFNDNEEGSQSWMKVVFSEKPNILHQDNTSILTNHFIQN